MTQITLIDINPEITDAWQRTFEGYPNIEVKTGDITKKAIVDVWVTPTNSKGHMSGGVDYAIKNSLGEEIERRIQEAIAHLYNGFLPVGRAVIVDSTSVTSPRYVVATPSMVGESDNLKRTKNTALACAAAFQAIYYAEDKHGAEINSVAIPGLGSGTGQVPPDLCAGLMKIGYTLFRRKRYESFDEMLEHLNVELGLIGQTEAAATGPQPGAGLVQQAIGFDNAHPGIPKGGIPLHDKETGAVVAYGEPWPDEEEKAPEEDTPIPSTAHGQQGNGDLSVKLPVVDYIKDFPLGTPVV